VTKKVLPNERWLILTIKNGGIQSSFIRPPSNKLQEISQTLLEKDRELHRRLKEIGDY
jgi:hypothetical protein